jgi:hypothetical protein
MALADNPLCREYNHLSPSFAVVKEGFFCSFQRLLAAFSEKCRQFCGVSFRLAAVQITHPFLCPETISPATVFFVV